MGFDLQTGTSPSAVCGSVLLSVDQTSSRAHFKGIGSVYLVEFRLLVLCLFVGEEPDTGYGIRLASLET